MTEAIPYTNRFGKPDEHSIVRQGRGVSRICRESDNMVLATGGRERAQELIDKGVA